MHEPYSARNIVLFAPRMSGQANPKREASVEY